MARYEHLPIYRAAFDLAVHVEKLVRGFSRYHEYSPEPNQSGDSIGRAARPIGYSESA